MRPDKGILENKLPKEWAVTCLLSLRRLNHLTIPHLRCQERLSRIEITPRCICLAYHRVFAFALRMEGGREFNVSGNPGQTLFWRIPKISLKGWRAAQKFGRHQLLCGTRDRFGSVKSWLKAIASWESLFCLCVNRESRCVPLFLSRWYRSWCLDVSVKHLEMSWFRLWRSAPVGRLQIVKGVTNASKQIGRLDINTAFHCERNTLRLEIRARPALT